MGFAAFIHAVETVITITAGADVRAWLWARWTEGGKGASFRIWPGCGPAHWSGSCSNQCPKGCKSLALSWASWRWYGQGWDPAELLMALRKRGQFWCPLLTPDEFSALIRMAKGPWGDQRGCQVGEGYMRLTDKNELKLKPKVHPAQRSGNAREYKNVIPGSVGSQRSGPWKVKVNLAPRSR